jgi:hypothetical protein
MFNVFNGSFRFMLKSVLSAPSVALVLLLLSAACSSPPASTPVESAAKPKDSAHAGITTPHGDHSAHHGGMVLMNGETHYEVVFDRGGKHRVWFSDAVREDLPASIASRVGMTVTRPGGAAAEALALQIDESGESWVANGQPISGSDVMVKLSIVARGEPYEIEIPIPNPLP